jgi:predicted NUDIX family NTP pyrophosphohydrolase
MPKQSAGILLFRLRNKDIEVLLAHPGGPFFKNKDDGAWTIPKGEMDEDEDPLMAAKREFKEETGKEINGKFIPLNPIKYKSGKIVYAWAVEGDIDPSLLKCNTFKLEWPPKSGKHIDVPELDRAEWFSVAKGRKKIIPAQSAFLDELEKKLN